MTALFIGELEMSRFRVRIGNRLVEQLAFPSAGVVTLAILRLIPIVGGLVVVASVAIGLGALALAAYRRALPAHAHG